MNELILFLSATVSVTLLVVQSVNNNHGRWLLSMVTSIGIGISQLALYKLLPGASTPEIVAWIAGGPVGNMIAQYLKRHDIDRIRRLHREGPR